MVRIKAPGLDYMVVGNKIDFCMINPLHICTTYIFIFFKKPRNTRRTKYCNRFLVAWNYFTESGNATKASEEGPHNIFERIILVAGFGIRKLVLMIHPLKGLRRSLKRKKKPRAFTQR
jgi:hypothetical protein